MSVSMEELSAELDGSGFIRLACALDGESASEIRVLMFLIGAKTKRSRFSHEYMAFRLGMARETVCRAETALFEKGLLVKKYFDGNWSYRLPDWIDRRTDADV